MVRSSRSMVVGVAAWLAVVLVGSLLVWTVISRAGSQVTAEDTSVPPNPPSAGSPRTSPAPSPEPTSATPPARQGAWSGAAGVVSAECRGAAISFVGANPSADGYLAEVEERGPETVEVHFEGRGEEDGNETKVTARCQDGEPVFTVEGDDD